MTNWIPISERMPTREDADELGEVVWKWADGTTCTGRFDEDPAVAWLPLPPYTPPKSGPTDAECDALAAIAPRFIDFHTEYRRWLADVTARIEREREGGAIDARGFPLKERGK